MTFTPAFQNQSLMFLDRGFRRSLTTKFSGLLLKRTWFRNACSGNFTVSPLTDLIRVDVVGAGGGGGAKIASTGNAAGGGGGSGALAEKTISVLPGSTHTITVGVGGVGGVGATNTAPAAGGSSSIVINKTDGTTLTVTAPGGGAAGNGSGVGGIALTGALGVGATVATNGDFNAGGESGDPGVCYTASVQLGGNGGCVDPWGGGGLGISSGSPTILPSGCGGGGGGAASATGETTADGSAGADGMVLVEEFTSCPAPPPIFNWPTASSIYKQTGIGALYETGTFLNRQVLTAASGTYIPTPGTKSVRLQMVGGGGAGGGVSDAAAGTAAGAGGNSGWYVEKFIVNGGVGYGYITGGAFTCGAGGTGGTGTGPTGGDTTVVIGGILFNAKGGTGGGAMTHVGAGAIFVPVPSAPAAGTLGGDIVRCDTGQNGFVQGVSWAIGGSGGSGHLGQGGLMRTSSGNGNSAAGNGGGGAGAVDGASATRTGGNGSAGIIIIDEYA